MTDPTHELDEIVVQGQRRRPGGTFPAGPGGGGPGGGNSGGEHQNEVEDPGTQPYEPPPHPCSDPEAALDWNADAAAAEAAEEIARLAALAGEDGLNYRERGAFLFRRSDGSIGVGPIHQSDPFDANGDAAVHLTYDGVDPNTIIGSIHSHRDGSHLPSGPSPRPEIGSGDVGHFAFLQALMNNPSQARIYIVARNQLGASQTPYNQINVYNEQNMQASQEESEVGPEVNPEAQPCP